MKCKQFLLAFMIFLAAGTDLTAQTESNKFSQKLEWKADPNVYEYHVEIRSIKKIDNIKTFETDKNYITFSLSAGDYEYRVHAYDFLGREASVTEWIPFSIIKALKPVITKTDSKVVKHDENQSKIEIPLQAEAIDKESKAEITNKETGETLEGKLTYDNTSDETKAAGIEFPNLSEGNWVVKITNPGGLSTETGEIEVTVTDEIKNLREQKRLEEERLAAEKLAEEERLAEQKRLEEERLAEEKRLEEERLAAEKRAEEERLAEEKRLEEERLAEEKRLEEERLAAEKRAEEERLAEQKRLEEERLAEEKRLAKEERKNRPAKDICFLAGYGVPFNITKTEPFTLEENGSPLINSINAKINWLPIKANSWQYGFEANAYLFMTKYSNEYLEVTFPTGLFQVNILAQYNLSQNKFGIRLHAGATVCLLQENLTYKAEKNINAKRIPYNEIFGNFGAQGGFSLVFIPLKHFEIEAGGDATVIFIPNASKPALFITPYICMGVRL